MNLQLHLPLVILLIITTTVCLIEAKYTRRPTTTTQSPKHSCRVCWDVGDDCKGGPIKNGCDGCAKFTGKVNNVDEVPDGLRNAVERDLPGAFTKIGKHKGQVVTVRACATPEILTVAEVASDDGFGCVDLEELYGFSDAEACLCDKDCESE